MNKTRTQFKAIDFFCGGGGMSYGFHAAGVNVMAGIDNDQNCEKTYLANIPNSKFICTDVNTLQPETLQAEFSLKRKDDQLILIGCSPCQYWSVINTNKTKANETKNLLLEFWRFVDYFEPGYVVVENVPGLLGKRKDSGLNDFILWLEQHGYVVSYGVHNINDYGVPQSRRRFTLIADRVNKAKLEPYKYDNEKRLVVRDVLGIKNGFPAIPDGHNDPTEFKHSVASLSTANKQRLKHVSKDGGNRMGFSSIPDLQLKCFIGRDNSFKDTFGRLWWDRPSPTITTKFFSVSNGRFVHPDEDRALSIREGATLQSFPKSYNFISSSVSATARMIGNAVPPEYAKRIALSIIDK